MYLNEHCYDDVVSLFSSRKKVFN